MPKMPLILDVDPLINDVLDNSTPLWDSSPRTPKEQVLANRVRLVLEQMKPEQRDLLEARYFLGEATADLARQRGVTERTMRKNLERARESFVKTLAIQEEQDATP